MNVRKLMLMAGALVFAAVCAFTARGMFGGTGPVQALAPAQPTGPQVLVATRTLPVGTIIGPDAFRYQTWPKDLIDNAYFIKGKDPTQQSALGTVVRYAVTAGQPITQGALIKPGDRGFLAAALAPGMRAISIAVSAQAGVAGFVFPGDRVDLLLTQTVAGGDGQGLKATETIVRNLRVLATDQKTDKTMDSDGKTVVAMFSNVTLESTPKIAEKIAVAQAVGTLSLSLRSIADDRMELEREIAAGEVNVPVDPRAQKDMLLRIATRPSDTDTTATTGGDVSRFQSRTVAPRVAAPTSGPPVGTPGPAVPAAPRGPIIVIARGNDVSQVSARN